MTTLSSLVSDFCDTLKTRFISTNLSPIFTDLEANEKVPFAYDLLESENFFPQFDRECSKSAFKATYYRNLGNDAFRQKKDVEALKYYIKSVASAPPSSPEEALAYANRSAALFRLGKYIPCLLDINRALNGKYPDSLKHKLHDRKNHCKLKLHGLNEFDSNISEPISELSLKDNPRLHDENDKLDLYDINHNATQPNFDGKFDLPEINFNNEAIPNASKKMRINFTPEMGRHLIAIADIEPGEILAIEKPYASILLPNFNYTHCSYCYIRFESLIPCTTCSLVMFCSERCRENASFLFHRTECQILSHILALEVGEMEYLALRALIIATKQGKQLEMLMNHPVYKFPLDKKDRSVREKFISEDYVTIHYLEDSFDKRCVADVFQRSLAVAFLLYLLKQTTFFGDKDAQNSYSELTDCESFAGTLLLKYLFNARSNAHEISELIEEKRSTDVKQTSQNLGIGAALYPLHSLINHSCDPNVVRHNHKDVIVSRALQPIKMNNQIFDNYGYHYATHPREDRHNHLRLQYYFECCCDPCKYDWPLHENLPSKNPEIISNEISVDKLNEYSAIFRKKLEILADEYSEEQFDFMCEYLSVLHKSTKRPSKEYNECQECIKQILATRGNHYKVPRDCVLLKM